MIWHLPRPLPLSSPKCSSHIGLCFCLSVSHFLKKFFNLSRVDHIFKEGMSVNFENPSFRLKIGGILMQLSS